MFGTLDKLNETRLLTPFRKKRSMQLLNTHWTLYASRLALLKLSIGFVIEDG